MMIVEFDTFENMKKPMLSNTIFSFQAGLSIRQQENLGSYQSENLKLFLTIPKK